MTAVRKIEISDNNGVPKFRFDSTGLPERPVIMHQCASCLADSVITNKDAGDLAAWLIGEAVDDAHGSGVIEQCGDLSVTETACIVAHGVAHAIHMDAQGQRWTASEKPLRYGTWAPSGPDDEAGTGRWPKSGRPWDATPRDTLPCTNEAPHFPHSWSDQIGRHPRTYLCEGVK